tara:strand:+ start:522 stop:1121 length:600 start_codon:yes stop_codon:yes gene_type:complete
MKEKPITLNEKLASIQTELKCKKDKYNSFGKYNYRSAEGILESLKPFLLKNGVSVTINETLEELSGMLIMKSISSISDGLDSIQAVALVAVDMDQRGMNAPQKFGSASSYAKKYSLGNLFLIDDTADSDATNTHGKTKNTAAVDVSKNTLTSIKDPLYAKALIFIEKGGDIKAITDKYSISAEVKKALEGAVPIKTKTL